MVIRRIINRFRTQDWAALVSELVIVIVGIFIAIQVDRWWEQQDDLQREQLYIARLAEDIERDIEEITYSIDLAAFTHTPALSSDTFEELRSTGNLVLLRNGELKAALFEYYRYDEGQRQYQSLQLMTEIRHFEFAAKILSVEQHAWVQDNYYVFGPRTVADARYPDSDMPGVIEAARRLQNAPDFVAWLPQARGIQLDLTRTHSDRARLAEALLELLTRNTGP